MNGPSCRHRDNNSASESERSSRADSLPLLSVLIFNDEEEKYNSKSNRDYIQIDMEYVLRKSTRFTFVRINIGGTLNYFEYFFNTNTVQVTVNETNK